MERDKTARRRNLDLASPPSGKAVLVQMERMEALVLIGLTSESLIGMPRNARSVCLGTGDRFDLGMSDRHAPEYPIIARLVS
jgi:hypothetical protein